MHGRITGLVAAALLAGGVALAGELPAPAPQTGQAQPVLDVQQRLPDVINPGEVVPIDVVITNSGSAPAENVTAGSNLPPSLDLREAVPPPERVRGSLLWTLGSLGPGQQQVLHLRVLPRGSAAEVSSLVRVTFQGSVTSSVAAPVRRPVLTLDVAGPEAALVGEPVQLLLTVRNAGITPARDVALQTLLPPGLSHPAGNDLENPLGTLAPGESKQIALQVMPTQAGEQRQRIVVHAAGGEPVEREACLRVCQVKMGLAVNGPRLLYETWPASFEIAVHNEGADAVRQVRLVAALPEGIAFVRATENGTYTADSHGLSWDLGDLGPGEERTLLWNGIARGTGEQVCRLTLTSGPRTHKALSWQTTVVRAAQPPAAATANSVPAAEPSSRPTPPAPGLPAPPPVTSKPEPLPGQADPVWLPAAPGEVIPAGPHSQRVQPAETDSFTSPRSRIPPPQGLLTAGT
jgi:uncharacterized repeat protein (TIGR01451 family)